MSVWYDVEVMVERWWSPEGAGVTAAEGQMVLSLLISVMGTGFGCCAEASTLSDRAISSTLIHLFLS